MRGFRRGKEESRVSSAPFNNNKNNNHHQHTLDTVTLILRRSSRNSASKASSSVSSAAAVGRGSRDLLPVLQRGIYCPSIAQPRYLVCGRMASIPKVGSSTILSLFQRRNNNGHFNIDDIEANRGAVVRGAGTTNHHNRDAGRPTPISSGTGSSSSRKNKIVGTLLSRQWKTVLPFFIMCYILFQGLMRALILADSASDTVASCSSDREPYSDLTYQFYFGAACCFFVSVLQQTYKIYRSIGKANMFSSVCIYSAGLTVNLIAGSSAILTVTKTYGPGGICKDMFGVESPAAQWGEWMVTVPLLGYISIAVEDKLWMAMEDYAVVVLMMLSIFFGFCINFEVSKEGAVCFLVLSNLALLVILAHAFSFGKDLERVQAFSNTNVISKEKVRELKNNRILSETRKNALARLLLIVMPPFPFVYFLGMAGVIDRNQVAIGFIVCSVLAKTVFVFIVSDDQVNKLEDTVTELAAEKQANDSRRAFLRYVFHEVRVPLNTISLGLSILTDDTDVVNPISMEAVQMMTSATAFMRDTLNDVLSIHKIEEGALELIKKPFTLEELIHGAVVTTRGLASEKHITVVTAAFVPADQASPTENIRGPTYTSTSASVASGSSTAAAFVGKKIKNSFLFSGGDQDDKQDMLFTRSSGSAGLPAVTITGVVGDHRVLSAKAINVPVVLPVPLVPTPSSSSTATTAAAPASAYSIVSAQHQLPKVQLVGDRFRLEHVIVNFLSNAIKFSPERSKIAVMVKVEYIDRNSSSTAAASSLSKGGSSSSKASSPSKPTLGGVIGSAGAVVAGVSSNGPLPSPVSNVSSSRTVPTNRSFINRIHQHIGVNNIFISPFSLSREMPPASPRNPPSSEGGQMQNPFSGGASATAAAPAAATSGFSDRPQLTQPQLNHPHPHPAPVPVPILDSTTHNNDQNTGSGVLEFVNARKTGSFAMLERLVTGGASIAVGGVSSIAAVSDLPPSSPLLCKVSIIVCDEGIGISEEDSENLFVPFSQIRPDMLQQGRGSGLGLALAKEIITLHGGEVLFESKVGAGSKFGFCIPFEMSPLSPEVSPAGSPAPLSGKNITCGWLPNSMVNSNEARNALERQSLSYYSSGGGGGGEKRRLVGSKVNSRARRTSSSSRKQGFSSNDIQSPDCTTLEGIAEAAAGDLCGEQNGEYQGENDLKRRKSASSKKKVLRAADVGTMAKQEGGGEDVEKRWEEKKEEEHDNEDSGEEYDEIGGGPGGGAQRVRFPGRRFGGGQEQERDGLDLNEMFTAAAAPAGRVPTRRYLVVDDTPSNSKMLKMILNKNKIECDIAENGQLAVDAVKNKGDSYDLIFMDFTMPVMTGDQATKKLREELNFPRLIIGLTGNALDDDVTRFVAAGVDCVISKPLRAKQLHAIIRYTESEGGLLSRKPNQLVTERVSGVEEDYRVVVVASI